MQKRDFLKAAKVLAAKKGLRCIGALEVAKALGVPLLNNDIFLAGGNISASETIKAR